MRHRRLRVVEGARDQVRKPGSTGFRGREQVAAICFRILSSGVEFLLVRTRRGRWTFPKGGVQSGLTHAQSAALEAFEEAGVHGRIEEIAFTAYQLRKLRDSVRSVDSQMVQAHLCEVLRLDEPEEANRNPTWFSGVKAKRRLSEGRSSENASELARVVDRALARIRRMPARTTIANDSLLTVKFEASELDVRRLIKQASTIGITSRETDASAPAVIPRLNIENKVLQLGLSPQKRSP
jgi:8-oxo-dGTP pyrophosphatase MutT (NUDIX family)